MATSPTTAALHLRSYHADSLEHTHDFTQLVLPVSGGIELDIAGRQGRADASTAAFVAPGERHATSASGANRSLILDLAPTMVDAALMERLAARQFTPLSPAAGKLVEFMALTLDQEQPSPDSPTTPVQLQHWIPLLLDTLASTPTHPLSRPASRLHALMARIEAEPGLPWSVAEMAATVAISPSRLHEWFREEIGATPRAWLAEVRIRYACDLLRNTALPLHEIALRCGYADQSALSNAMRKLRDTTPAAYRRAG